MLKHSEAVEKAIEAAGPHLTDVDAALLALLRTLAAQLDAVEPDPSTRLTAAYLSALKDLRRAVGDEKDTGPTPGLTLARLRAVGRGEGPTPRQDHA